jgi:hypothetical protein
VKQALTDNMQYFVKFEPENGWGGYDDALGFITQLDRYLVDCPNDYTLKVH